MAISSGSLPENASEAEKDPEAVWRARRSRARCSFSRVPSFRSAWYYHYYYYCRYASCDCYSYRPFDLSLLCIVVFFVVVLFFFLLLLLFFFFFFFFPSRFHNAGWRSAPHSPRSLSIMASHTTRRIPNGWIESGGLLAGGWQSSAEDLKNSAPPHQVVPAASVSAQLRAP